MKALVTDSVSLSSSALGSEMVAFDVSKSGTVLGSFMDIVFFSEG